MRLSCQTVGEIMRSDVTSVRADLSVRELVRLLAERGIGGVPVLDEVGRPVGVVSATDVLREAAREPERRMESTLAIGEAAGEPEPIAGYYGDPGGPHPQFRPLLLSVVPPDWLDTHRVSDIMTRTLYAVCPETSVEELARLFLRHGIHRALVSKDDELVGIVTSLDVLRCVAGPSESSTPSP
jgi:CBS domain-containing protein